MRRLDEAQTLARLGVPVPSNLKRRLQNMRDIPTNEYQAVQQEQWGAARRLAYGRLTSLLRVEQQKKLQVWKDRVGTFSGACRWVRQEDAKPYVVQTPEGRVMTSRVTALHALNGFWNIFGTPDQAISTENFFQVFQHDLPNRRECEKLPKIQCSDVKRMAMKMRKKATGTDGVAAEFLTWLPQPPLIRLCQFLHACERQGIWPEPLLHWKVCFLPKNRTDGTIPSLGDVRPISVGPVVYRIWSSIHLQHLRNFLSQSLLKDQAGFLGPDVQSVLLTMDLDYVAEQYPFAVALDFAKAFDSTDAQLCIRLLEHVGVPKRVTTLLQSQWTGHKKWITFGGAISKTPMQNTLGLPQGDAWSPICMSLVMAVAGKYTSRIEPSSKSILYIDDRTIIAPSREALLRTCHAWEQLYEVTRLKNNDEKQQFFARAISAYVNMQEHGIDAKPHAEVLGVSIGITPRKRTPKELQRKGQILRAAQRIALLPGAHSLKAALAACVLANKRTWGELFNGRAPTIKEGSDFTQICRKAVKGFETWQGHDSRDLCKILKMGHMADLNLFVCQRFLSALHKWFHKNPAVAGPLSSRPSIRALNICLSRIDCRLVDKKVQLHSGEWDLNAPVPWLEKLSHGLRQHWRRWTFNRWLQSKRNDASLARTVNLRHSYKLIDQLRSCARSTNGHCIGVMIGGVQTDAHFHTNQTHDNAVGDDFCWDCNMHVRPCTHHILWQCEKFASFRKLSCHSCPFLARMGWNARGPNLPILRQLSEVRAAAAKERERRMKTKVSSAPADAGADAS